MLEALLRAMPLLSFCCCSCSCSYSCPELKNIARLADARFAEFWEAYPKKVDKQEAQAQWRRF